MTDWLGRSAKPIDTPEWVLLGAPYDDEFIVLGSSDLRWAELQAEFHRSYLHSQFGELDGPMRQVQCVLTADLRTYSVALGSTYAEAIAKLMGTWNPDDRSRGVLDAGTRAITEGSPK